MINSNFSGRKLIGSGGELYVASLFGGLTIINNGNNMPDLKSRKGQFTKPLLLEVKAGKGREGISVNYQLHYSIRTRSDFDTVLGSHLRDDAIRSFDPEDAPSLMYYSFPRRIDCVAGNDFNHSFTSLLLEWGDQYLVPGRFVFYNFAARLAMSEKIGLLSALDQVEDLTRGSIVGFRENTGEYNRWGHVRLSDVNAIMESDHSLTTPQGNNCLKLLRLIYPAVESLRKVKIDGPNNTKIHILANPKDEQLFDIELRSVVRTRIPIIEEITTQRRSTRSLLDRISPRTSQLTLFGEEKSLKGKNKKDISFHDLSLDEITYLEKLAKWELPD